MFKKGDRVIIVEDCRKSVGKSYSGVTGVVYKTGADEVDVIFDNFMDGHALRGECKNGHGWYFLNLDEDELYKDGITIRKFKKKNNYW